MHGEKTISPARQKSSLFSVRTTAQEIKHKKTNNDLSNPPPPALKRNLFKE